MSLLPHRWPGIAPEDAEAWSHIFFGTWTGAPHTPSARANMCDHPGVMLLCPGSNSVLGGFRDPSEAEAYREAFGLDWKVCDRTPEDPGLSQSENEPPGF